MILHSEEYRCSMHRVQNIFTSQANLWQANWHPKLASPDFEVNGIHRGTVDFDQKLSSLTCWFRLVRHKFQNLWGWAHPLEDHSSHHSYRNICDHPKSQSSVYSLAFKTYLNASIFLFVCVLASQMLRYRVGTTNALTMHLRNDYDNRWSTLPWQGLTLSPQDLQCLCSCFCSEDFELWWVHQQGDW